MNGQEERKLTKSLMNVIEKGNISKVSSLTDFLRHAKKNKVLYFLLERANSLPDSLSSLYHSLEAKDQRIRVIIKKVAEIFKEEGVEYCFFKTLRPVPYVPADLDVLIFSNDDMDTATRVIRERLQGEVDSTARFDRAFYLEDVDFYIDLYNEVHVANFSYLSKDHLKQHRTTSTVQGTPVKVLIPECELLSLLGHAIFKEQIITLLDRYSIYSLFSTCDMTILRKELKHTNMITSLNLFVSITRKHQAFPVSITIPTLSKLFLLKLLKDSRSRKMLPHFISQMSKKEKLLNAINHLRRETY